MTKKQDDEAAKTEANEAKAEAKTDHRLLMAVAHATRLRSAEVKAILQAREAEADKAHKDK